MKRIHTVPNGDWDRPFPLAVREATHQALEDGQALFFPSLAFLFSPAERRFLDPAILARSKNVSYNPDTTDLRGTSCQGQDAEDVKTLMHRYADAARSLFDRLLFYGPALRRDRTSLRPAEIEGRVSHWRKDDKLLHVDSFPSMPVHGRRILRLFCNVNPDGRPRTWRLGEPFPKVAERFWPTLSKPQWLKRQLLSLFRVTKGLRSEYDHYMLELHDAMKADADYQKNASQEKIDFPAGCAWACFTDQVSHAALAGQHQLEQTFTLPVEAMRRPETAPLKVLEQLAGKALVIQDRRAAA